MVWAMPDDQHALSDGQCNDLGAVRSRPSLSASTPKLGSRDLKTRVGDCLRRSDGGPGIINESCVLRDVVHHDRPETRIMATPGAIIIRQALLGDAAGFPNLMTELGYPATERFDKERLAQLASDAGDVVFIADCAGVIVGFLSFHVIPLFHVEGNLGRITALVVSSRFRRCGIGKELVTAAEEFAWAHGCVRVEITSGAHRADAHAFYEAVGYRQETRRFLKSK